MFLVAINAIDRGRSANPRVIEPGHILKIEVDATFQNLIEIQAMREATEDECKIAEALGTLHYDGAEVESSDADAVVGAADNKKSADKKPAVDTNVLV